MVAECPSCSETFSSKHGVKIHHATTHGESITKVEKSCDNCGEDFSRNQSLLDEDSSFYFCSHSCKIENQTNKVTVMCEFCNSKIVKKESDVSDKNFCSRECLRKCLTKEYDCDYCGEKFTRPQSTFSESQSNFYCSNSCYLSSIKENTSSPINKDWRRKVYERDNYKCQDCGSDKNIHAHHIKTRAEHPNLSQDVENGVSLCKYCHAKRHEEMGQHSVAAMLRGERLSGSDD